ncbi:MAG: glycosyltransferase family 2 protein [Chitinophagaceae bacterium]|nr:glycosyltransferase family 2 protein [Chitinophagaceae bacterium]MCB9045871.1 glycosyltransferase family 2 protein [Chitinophagales bacterium]
MFGSKWVLCVFSYNRGMLLRNLLRSARLFYPEFDIVIFDDNSDDAETQKVLTEQGSTNCKVIISPSDHTKSKHGGLYAQMNKALMYAIDHQYSYAYFVQDDMQFLWRDEVLENKITKAFTRKECLMCNSSFLQKILTDGIEDRLPLAEDNLYTFKGNGVADTGIIDLEKAREADLQFPEHSESGNGQYWYNKGFRLYWLPQPHLAWVPWPATFRNRQKENRKTNELLPLTDESIKRLQQNQSYAYLEDYTKTVRLLPKPYWYTANPGKLNLLKIYIKYYLKHII